MLMFSFLSRIIDHNKFVLKFGFSSDLASCDGCGEGFLPDDVEAVEAGGAAEGEEHLGGVGASCRRHVALARPRKYPSFKKHVK